jgi:NADH dehydrogenase [ubiquinone] 1 alpha subcomplex assembly factor 7
MTLADYMADCLLHPAHGYYATRDPFGAARRFHHRARDQPDVRRTSGPLPGAGWLDQGAPNPFTLAELGPGRGTLMADILRATRGVPGFHAAPGGAGRGLARLAARRCSAPRWATIRCTGPTAWKPCPTRPLFLIANEFFDALPIRQFTRQGHGWAERWWALPGTRSPLAAPPPPRWRPSHHRLADTPEGGMVEICPAAAPIMARIGGRSPRHGGRRWSSTTAAGGRAATRFRRCAAMLHRPAGRPRRGRPDRACGFRGAGPPPPPPAPRRMTPQGALLQRLGIDARAARLARA